MKPVIPKEPQKVPDFTEKQIEWLTEIIFMKATEIEPCEAVFIFGGTHPGHWEKAIEAYESRLGKTFIVTGGVSPTGVKHEKWEDAGKTESVFIREKLLVAGIEEAAIHYETTSRNSAENVIHTLSIVDYSQINSLLVVCKAHGAGRQIRTLQQHLPDRIKMIPYGFPAIYHGVELNSENWHLSGEGRARIWGEYLRICKYGDLGHLKGLTSEERLL
jgi:hypothetical protein